jgi:flagellar L-ring protein precursor FlgH
MGYEKSLEEKNRNLSMSNLYKASMSNNFDGSGETTRAGNLTATLTCMVVRVLSNGNLLIQGDKDVQVNHETQYIRLYGIIRPQDIESDNSIYSDKIADARIIYSGRGVVSDKQISGWATRILDWIWPF